jgi:antitoxin ParD1/3/4
MPNPTSMTVRLNAVLSDYVAENVGENGAYENVSEFVRDLIRRDRERSEQEKFERLKLKLQTAFEAPDDSYKPLSVHDVVARNIDRDT